MSLIHTELRTVITDAAPGCCWLIESTSARYWSAHSPLVPSASSSCSKVCPCAPCAANANASHSEIGDTFTFPLPSATVTSMSDAER